jgi:hypothetical protein
MDFEFHPDQWLRMLQQYPVLQVLLGGAIGGTCFTQLVKKSAAAFAPLAISDRRYRVSVLWLSVLSTFSTTNWLWLGIIHDTGTGLRHVVSIIAGVSSPFSYDGMRALVAWKFPEFAAKWGSNGHS